MSVASVADGGFPQPLAGLRVLDLSLLLPGPYCTALLAAFGAEIVKVEPPGGDPVRRLNPELYRQYARNKQSIVLNLKDVDGLAAFLRLAEGADAVLEGFRPGTADRLGIGPKRLRELNPRLVYASLSGFGQTGPYRNRAAHDLNYLALAGYYAVPSQLDGAKARPNVRLADLAAGQQAALAMAMALMAARGSGRGTTIDVGVFDCIAAMALPLLLASPAGADAVEMPHVMADSDLFTTADGSWITLGTLEDKFWCAFASACRDLEPALAEERWATRRGRDGAKRDLSALLRKTIGRETLAQWRHRLDAVDTAWAPVAEGRELLDDPHFAARGLRVGDGYVRFPVLFDGTAEAAPHDAPALGADGARLLREAGLDAAIVARLTVPAA